MWRKILRVCSSGRLGWNLLLVAPGVMAMMAVTAASAPAWAQSQDVVGALEQDAREDRPWAEGVPQAQQERARRVFADANRSMRDGLFAQAAARYDETLTLWDHPGAHYNLGLAQLSLDQPIGAYESFGRALRFGPSPLLGQEKYDQAQRYREVLAKQLARIEVVCEEEGAAVTLDGQPLFTGPGRYEGMVRPGGHQLVASKPGRIPATEQAVLSPGEQGRYVLVPGVPETVQTERRWAAWKPWAVVGAGALVMAGAGYLDQRSSQGFDSFDSEFDTLCNTGCPENEVPVALRDTLDRATLEQRGAQISYAVGGAALATGVVLVYLNRERLVRRGGGERAALGAKPGARSKTQRESLVVPILGPDRAGIQAALRF